MPGWWQRRASEKQCPPELPRERHEEASRHVPRYTTASLLFCFSFGLLYLRILHSLAVTALCAIATAVRLLLPVLLLQLLLLLLLVPLLLLVVVVLVLVLLLLLLLALCRCVPTKSVRGAKISALFITAVQCSKFFAAMRCTALLSALSRAVAARAEPFEHFLVHIWEIGGRGQGSAAMALVPVAMGGRCTGTSCRTDCKLYIFSALT